MPSRSSGENRSSYDLRSPGSPTNKIISKKDYRNKQNTTHQFTHKIVAQISLERGTMGSREDTVFQTAGVNDKHEKLAPELFGNGASKDRGVGHGGIR